MDHWPHCLCKRNWCNGPCNAWGLLNRVEPNQLSLSHTHTHRGGEGIAAQANYVLQRGGNQGQGCGHLPSPSSLQPRTPVHLSSSPSIHPHRGRGGYVKRAARNILRPRVCPLSPGRQQMRRRSPESRWIRKGPQCRRTLKPRKTLLQKLQSLAKRPGSSICSWDRPSGLSLSHIYIYISTEEQCGKEYE